MFNFKRKLQFLTSILLLSSSLSYAALTDLAQAPLNSSNNVKPNVTFAVDDSGSMDWEILLNTNSGEAWWNTVATNGVQPGFVGCHYTTTGSVSTQQCNAANVANGIFNSNAANAFNNNERNFAYLFPNGIANDAKKFSITSVGVVPPLNEYAYFRNAKYNPLYYNPLTTYAKWIDTNTHTFVDANPQSVKSHPIYTGSANLDLTQQYIPSSKGNYEFGFYIAGNMTIRGDLIPNLKYWNSGSNNWSDLNFAYTPPSNGGLYVSIPYWIATYYVDDPTCTKAEILLGACSLAPNGSTTMRKYEIKPTTTVYPGGRAYADELQNFANWFQFYRKRRLMLGGSMAQVLPDLTSINGGITTFGNTTGSKKPITMYDLDNPVSFYNILNPIYESTANVATQTRTVMKFVGEQHKTNKNIVKFACQKNANIVMTDGYANWESVTAPAYTNTFANVAPYTTTVKGSLADIALSYYTNNLRPDLLPTGSVPKDSTNSGANPDFNNNIHLNTYAVTIGANGVEYGNSYYGTGDTATDNAFLTNPKWIYTNNIGDLPFSIDDLWHATVNSRGTMFTASNADDIKDMTNNILGDIISKASSRSAVAVSTVNIKNGDNSVYVASYSASNWNGELAQFLINTTTGQVDTNGTPYWSARNNLAAMTPSSRKIATYDGNNGIPFNYSLLPTTMKNQLRLSSLVDDSLAVSNWIRGDRTLESPVGPYRKRTSILGDIVNAEPVYVRDAIGQYTDPGYIAFSNSIATRTPALYQASNDGMMHVFNATTGQENWAYIPNLVFPNLKNLAKFPYNHQYYTDGTPAFADVDLANTEPMPTSAYTPNWKTILVSGLRGGGKGFYAIDITNSNATSETDAVNKILWEFPNAGTPTSIVNNIGYSYGKPLIVKTKDYGWVVLLSSGYNNDSGDGKGHLFILNANTGALIQDISTNFGSPTTPSGLTYLSAWANNITTSAEIDSVYGGDLSGNIWKFNLSSLPYSVSKFAQLKDTLGNPQPITTTIELGKTSAGQRIIYIGTGKTLSNTDLSTTSLQSMYAIVDDLSNNTISNVRSGILTKKVVTVDTSNILHINQDAIDYTTKKGWIVDFINSGERIAGDPQLVGGVLVFTTNIPSPFACSSVGYIYTINGTNGGELPIQAFSKTGNYAFSGKSLGLNLTSRPVIVQMPDGTIDALLHNADNSISTITLPTSSKTKVKIGSWKEIIRK